VFIRPASGRELLVITKARFRTEQESRATRYSSLVAVVVALCSQKPQSISSMACTWKRAHFSCEAEGGSSSDVTGSFVSFASCVSFVSFPTNVHSSVSLAVVEAWRSKCARR
jgi:hypothetical protein